jgi:hypothetical protein
MKLEEISERDPDMRILYLRSKAVAAAVLVAVFMIPH